MAGESLKELKASFRQWRRSKRHATERMPIALAEQVRRAAAAHGVAEVTKITGSVGRRILTEARRKGSRPRAQAPSASAPAFSRIPLNALNGPSQAQPMAEVETPQGIKLRVFSALPETLDLIRKLVEAQIGGAA
jgi:hypothetical protein